MKGRWFRVLYATFATDKWEDIPETLTTSEVKAAFFTAHTRKRVSRSKVADDLAHAIDFNAKPWRARLGTDAVYVEDEICAVWRRVHRV